jgi:GT2 family glycosyltransferase
MISIIIVNYNTSEILGKCIESVYKYENENNFKIIVVDNFSDDKNINQLKSLLEIYTEVRTIFLDKKVGFSEANNIGFRYSSGKDYILIMNPDIIFTRPLFDDIIKIMEKNKKIGAVCPLLVGTDGKFQYMYFQKNPSVCRYIFFDSIISRLFENSERLKKKYLYDYKIRTDTNEIQFVNHIPCAFFFTTAKIFSEVEMMDTSYELFFEDMDLSYRIGKNYNLAVISFLQVLHLSGTSFRTEDNGWMYGRFIFGMINFTEKHLGKSKARNLECVSSLNSHFVLLMEKVKGLFGKADEHRIKKHIFFLSLLKKKKNKLSE